MSRRRTYYSQPNNNIVSAVSWVIVFVMLAFIMLLVFGTMFDNIADAATGAMVFGKPAWITIALERFGLINICIMGLVIATFVWLYLVAIRVGDYSREL